MIKFLLNKTITFRGNKVVYLIHNEILLTVSPLLFLRETLNFYDLTFCFLLPPTPSTPALLTWCVAHGAVPVCPQLKSGGGGRRRGGQRHRGKGLNAASLPAAVHAGAAGTAWREKKKRPGAHLNTTLLAGEGMWRRGSLVGAHKDWLHMFL